MCCREWGGVWCWGKHRDVPPGASLRRRSRSCAASADEVEDGHADVLRQAQDERSYAASTDQVQHCHSHRYTILHLLFDYGLEAGGDAGGDFDAFIDGAGVHDERALCSFGEAFFGELVEGGVLAEGGEEAAGHALFLEAEGHDDVGVFDREVEVGFDGDVGEGEKFSL